MAVIILPDADAVAERAARLVADVVAAKPRAVLGLAAGATPVGLYRRLVGESRAGRLDLSGIVVFSLDDYVGLAPGHPASCRTCIETHFIAPLGLPPERVHLLGEDWEPAAYERAIAAAGGIDVQILGLGVNGHIAFNEPGSALDGRTRRVTLSESTRAVNRKAFPTGEAVPAFALSMGIGTILEARRVLLLATGAAKAAALAAALDGPLTEDVPASALRRHPDLVVLADAGAAQRLGHR